MGLFSLLLVIMAVALDQGQVLFRRISSRSDSEAQLRRALPKIQEDLKATSPTKVETMTNPPAVWFLSNQAPPVLGGPSDPSTYVPVWDTSGGAAVWQRHIVYYLMQPGGHDALAQQSCTGYTGDNDSVCPHKMLVRMEITFADPDPTVPAQIEPWSPPTLASFVNNAVRPNGYNVQSMVGTTINGAKIKRAEIVARNLLSFNVTQAAGGVPPMVTVDMRAVAIGQAQREVALGVANLATSRWTTQYLFTVIPRCQ